MPSRKVRRAAEGLAGPKEDVHEYGRTEAAREPRMRFRRLCAASVLASSSHTSGRTTAPSMTTRPTIHLPMLTSTYVVPIPLEREKKRTEK